MVDSGPNNNVQGIILILLGALFLSVMDAVVKVLLDTGFSVLQILAVRSWFVVPAMAVWAWRVLPPGALRTKRPALHFARAGLGFFAPFFFFSSLSTLPLADATVIFFGATFLMTALSVPLLKEHVGPHRWMAVVVGFFGVVVAANPGGDFFQSGAVFALLSSLSYSLFMLITRWMGPGEGAYKQVLYFQAYVGVASSAFITTDFKPMAFDDLGLVVVISVIAVLGQLSLTRAFSIAPVGVVAPFEYSAMVWASLMGYWLWGHIPGQPTIVGAAIIVVSGLYLLHRETRLKRRERALSVDTANTIEAAPPPTAVPMPMVGEDEGRR
ncbi:DMT family transporter [Magnetovibrio sp.]|uniref:DMT family transporter n=1 Tax=Magnetovibrio sp. TaxID=2024836 RepID=UPI002F939C74